MNEHNGVAQLCLTYDCQCDCRHCGVKYFHKVIKNEMSLERIRRIFEDLKACRFRHIDLSGGEPTLRKDLFQIIRMGKQCGFSMSIETNGLKLTPTFLLQLQQAGLDTVYLSMDDHRAIEHDERRGYSGVFDSALAGLRSAHSIGLPVHVSMVPKDRDYFIKGLVNDQIRFCLVNGAEKIRILFPSYVGKCSKEHRDFCSQDDEMALLDHIDKSYQDVVYIESAISPLSKVLEERQVPCPAKSVFSYISCNGYVMPCPYLPIVFGDLGKESMAEVLSRMHDHPFMHKDGLYCPTRDSDYLATILKEVTLVKPFIHVPSLNKINCFAQCNNTCQGCSLPKDLLSDAELMRHIAMIDSGYKSIHLYGGEIFLRPDIFPVLEKASQNFEMILYSNARVFAEVCLVDKIHKLNIRAVKVPFFSGDEKQFERTTKVKGSYRQTLLGIARLSRAGIPVSVYIPEGEHIALKLLISLGVASISCYEMGAVGDDSDSVMCFGARVRKTRLLWLKA